MGEIEENILSYSLHNIVDLHYKHTPSNVYLFKKIVEEKNYLLFTRSGILNFCAVAMSLHDMGYRPLVSDFQLSVIKIF